MRRAQEEYVKITGGNAVKTPVEKLRGARLEMLRIPTADPGIPSGTFVEAVTLTVPLVSLAIQDPYAVRRFSRDVRIRERENGKKE